MQELEIALASKDLLLANPGGLPNTDPRRNWSQSPHLSLEESGYEKTLRDLQGHSSPAGRRAVGGSLGSRVVFCFGYSVLRGPECLPPSRGISEQAFLFTALKEASCLPAESISEPPFTPPVPPPLTEQDIYFHRCSWGRANFFQRRQLT